MSLNKLVRSASRVVPSAVRAFAGGRCCSHRHYRSALSAATVNGRPTDLSLLRSFPSFLHRYSTQTSPEKSLLENMQYEVECVNHSLPAYENEEKVPEGFPFKIEDRVGTETITLTRDYEGETISVEVYMPDLVTGEGGDCGSKLSSVPLIVKTSKKSGPYLEFCCSAYPDFVVIDNLSVKNPEITEEKLTYEGPEFASLDENLQKALHRYLEIRGIEPSTTNFLHGYMIDKDTREYAAWLKKITNYLLA